MKIFVVQQFYEKGTKEIIIDDKAVTLVFINSISDIINFINEDYCLWHYGRLNSVDITKDNLKSWLEYNTIVDLSKIINFSVNSTNEQSWDKFCQRICTEADWSISELKEELKKFQNNLERNSYKIFLRTSLGMYLSKTYSLEVERETGNPSEANLSEFLRTGEDLLNLCKNINTYRKKLNFELNIKTDGFLIELTNSVNLIKELIKKDAEVEINFIIGTLFFRPSRNFWKEYINYFFQATINILIIAPWRTIEDYEKEGYEPDKHKNIILWNPILENLEELRKKIRSVEVNLIGNKDRLYDFSSIQNLLFNENLITDNDIGTISEFTFSFSKITQFAYENYIKTLRDTQNEFEFLYILDSIGIGYDLHTHEYNAANNPFSTNYAQESKKFIFKQICNDIFSSIKDLYKGEILIDNNEKKKVVIIDDMKDANLNKISIKALFDSFGNKFEYEIINPTGKNYFNNIKKYSTLYNQGNNEDDDLNKILDADILLVDLLYKDNMTLNSPKAEDGIQFISGLNRYLRDFKPKKIHFKVIPPIVVLSQDDNPINIFAAIKAGAKDYLIKSRPFLLPGTLNKVLFTAGDSTDTYHRNFRALYNLRTEAIDLLQKVKIPKESHEKFESLLKVLPKTDLHVHVGSCMIPEFLVLSSFISLLRHDFKTFTEMSDGIKLLQDLSSLDKGKKNVRITLFEIEQNLEVETGEKWIYSLRQKTLNIINNEFDLRLKNNKKEAITEIKSWLHFNFNIPDYYDNDKIKAKIESLTNFEVAFFAIKNVCKIKQFDDFDYVRLYILILATKYESAELFIIKFKFDFLSSFFKKGKLTLSEKEYEEIRNDYYDVNGTFSINNYRDSGWKIRKDNLNIRVLVPIINEEVPTFEKSPIEFTLATGTRSSNLVEYLEGCEFSGAEHLKHPYLIHVYARQTIYKFIEHGVCYSELRGSPSGYVNRKLGFDFADVINCFTMAFNEAQKEVYSIFKDKNYKLSNYWNILTELTNIISFNENNEWKSKRLPCKVNLIITGKRHKPIREMILEAAAAATLKKSITNLNHNTKSFVDNTFLSSEVVGFDLAGKEEGNPPEKFIEEFARLSKLHIPLTIHAGENASSEFIESAIVKLGALRIGHGLSLAEDKGLLNRAREENVCIELCPECNHQTSHFSNKGRKYPLEEYLKKGLLVCINSDNPIISNTNITKEYIKASSTLTNGLSLWEALRIMRMGFVSAFMPLPDRKYMLDVIDQYLFDIFNYNEVIDYLYELNSN